jgi:hypothetical protein
MRRLWGVLCVDVYISRILFNIFLGETKMNYELLVQLESARQILPQLFFWLEVAIMMVKHFTGQ